MPIRFKFQISFLFIVNLQAFGTTSYSSCAKSVIAYSEMEALVNVLL